MNLTKEQREKLEKAYALLVDVADSNETSDELFEALLPAIKVFEEDLDFDYYV